MKPTSVPSSRKLTLSEIAAEPFRMFFPAAILAGLLGVAVWPLHFGGVLSLYPGAGHTRLMGQGFFGGFIVGFLGTALPRMLSTRALPAALIGWLLLCFVVFVGGNFLGRTMVGDAAFLTLLVSYGVALSVRFCQRNDLPPPGFVLVALAFVCGLLGTVIGLLDAWVELDPNWLVLRPLIAYQGFVLLPVLGVGGFILPRFLGLKNQQDFPESLQPSRAWLLRALFALSTGIVVLTSFALEVGGWYRTAYLVRFVAAAIYLLSEVPVHRAGCSGGAVGWTLRVGIGLVLLGLVSVALLPMYRVALLHIFLVGGLGVITLVVATRVVYGHSGNAKLLVAPNRWLWVALGLILVGMTTRISGDFLPHIMISHYNYGALFWALGIGLWAWKVLPGVLVVDREK